LKLHIFGVITRRLATHMPLLTTSLEVWFAGLFPFPAFLGQAADLLFSAHERV